MRLWLATACLNTVCCIIFMLVVWSGDSSLHMFGAGAAGTAAVGTVYAFRTRSNMRDRDERYDEDGDGTN